MHRRAILAGVALLGALVLFSRLAPVPAPTRDRHGEREREERSGALEALDFWTQARAYPAADIAADRYYREFVRARAQISEDAPALLAEPWQSIGPTNFSGRMISVAVHPTNPNIVYAGSASGGLWRSATGGLGGDWTRVATSGFPVLGVNAIAISSSDPATMYIGTGEVYRYQNSVGGLVGRTTRGSYGLGILKTTDGGATWTKSLDWSYHQERGVQAIRLNPQNPGTLFAATTEGVYRSRDGGATWSLVLGVLMARDIAVDASDTTRVLASCGDFASPGAGIYRSVNGGTSFAPVGGLPSFSGYARLEPYAAHPNVVYLSLADSTSGNGGLYRTTDFGASWTLVNGQAIYDVQGWYSHFVAVNPADSSRIIRGAVSIFTSTDGGVTHTDHPNDTWADHHDYAHDPSNPNVLYVADDGGIWRTNDFGNTWLTASGGIVTAQFYNGFSNSAQDSLLALGQVQDHFGSQYSGSTVWEDGGVDEVGWTAINQENDAVMYAVTRNGGNLQKSIDRGVTYAALPVGGGFGPRCWNTPVVLSTSNPAVLYFAQVRVFKSVDSGAHWAATGGGATLDGNPVLSMAMSTTSPETVFVATAPVVTRTHWFRTVNGGTTWTDVTGTLPDRYPLDLAVDPSNSRHVYAALGGFGSGHLFKSMNAGESWTDITGTLPDVPATAVLVDPLNSNHVYVGNDIGVYLSTDGGSSWTGFNQGFPEALIVADLAVTPSNRMLRAATHGSGVYERKLSFVPGASVASGPIAAGRPILSLSQNTPNPFRGTTVISYELAAPARTRLTVLDARGREVAVLVDAEESAGSRSIRFDASGLAPGIYYYRVSAGGGTESRKMLVLR